MNKKTSILILLTAVVLPGIAAADAAGDAAKKAAEAAAASVKK